MAVAVDTAAAIVGIAAAVVDTAVGAADIAAAVVGIATADIAAVVGVEVVDWDSPMKKSPPLLDSL